MSLHFVETSEEESCLVVARYIGDVLDGEKVSRHKQLVFLKHQLSALVWRCRFDIASVGPCKVLYSPCSIDKIF